MKPTITICNANRRGSFDPAMPTRQMPLITNYNYHSATFENFRAKLWAEVGPLVLEHYWRLSQK
jgi:hypothetical protein